MSLTKRLAALEASKNRQEAWRNKSPRDMTDDELLQGIFQSGVIGWDISLFPGATLAERADAAERALRGELEVSDEARYRARGWFADQAADQAGLRKGEAYDRFVVEWIAERYGPSEGRAVQELTTRELEAELARLDKQSGTSGPSALSHDSKCT